MEPNSDWIICDGEIVTAGKAVVPATSRGLMYGDGVFETLRSYGGQTLFLDEYLKRLASGLDILGIPKVDELGTNQLQPLIYQLLQKQNLLQKDAIIRVQVWRDGDRGYTPNQDVSTHFSITASACPDTFSPPRLVTVNRRRIPSVALPSGYKFSNGINYILAAREAGEKGGDDALMQTVEGFISETTIANLFWSKGDTIFTPSTHCDLLPGITRGILVNLIQQSSNWELQEGKFALEHILQADSVWMCNSVREVLPVAQIDDHYFDVEGSLLHELQRMFNAFRDANLKSLKE